jgi:hypothetical protein
MPLQATSGAASYDAFGGGVPVVPNYIEDVFSTWLYTGNGTSQTITNGIDLAGKGGMVWIKSRSDSENNAAFDTSRGVNNYLLVNTDFAQLNYPTFGITAFNSNGFSVAGGAGYAVNTSASTYASWTFREQAKFFDIVTYTGTGVARTIAHNLGSVPGCMIIKKTNAVKDWAVYHRSTGNTQYLSLNTNAAAATSASYWNNTTPTSTVFTVGIDGDVNANGDTYVAYLFAHDAGGFGLTGTDNVISCGSYVGDGTTRLINIGYEPQWILIKNADSTDAFSADNWKLIDNMRGFTATSNSAILNANVIDAENNDNPITIASQGFNTNNFRATGKTYIYITIRRGPMKVPTTGTSVFKPVTRAGTSGTATVTGVGFAPDMCLTGTRDNGAYDSIFDRLRGLTRGLFTPVTNAEDASFTNSITSFTMDGMTLGADTAGSFSDVVNGSGANYVYWLMRRAPSFFDEVCYTGNNTAGRTVTHNLGVVPELMIVKSRSNAINWAVYYGVATNALRLNANTGATSETYWNDTSPTASVFYVGSTSDVNQVNYTYVAYLFATCVGVSKVGSYTGTGATQTINCGFGASGSRFVLIKRTDSTGDWYVWDSARGMVSGTDPSLLLNSTAVEVNANSVYAISTGFQIVSTAAGINASGGSYIFLSVA